MSHPSASLRRGRTTLLAIGVAIVAGIAPGATAAAAPATDATATVSGGGTAAIDTTTTDPAAMDATPTLVPASLFVCWSNPAAATPTGTPQTTHTGCTTATIIPGSSVQTVGDVAVIAADLAGNTTNTGGMVATVTAASASQRPTQRATADATAALTTLTVGKTTIKIRGLSSASAIKCTYGAMSARYSFRATSTVQAVQINGHRVRLHNGTMTINFTGGKLTLNKSQLTSTGIVQQAATLDTAKAHVVLAESAVAIAGAKQHACQA